MQFKTFREYLLSVYDVSPEEEKELYEENTVDGVFQFGQGEDDRICFFYADEGADGCMLSFSAYFGRYDENTREEVIALIDEYNAREDREYDLNYLNDQVWVELGGACLEEEEAVQMVLDVINFFNGDSDVVVALRKLSLDDYE